LPGANASRSAFDLGERFGYRCDRCTVGKYLERGLEPFKVVN
jgi:hypothetical protein